MAVGVVVAIRKILKFDVPRGLLSIEKAREVGTQEPLADLACEVKHLRVSLGQVSVGCDGAVYDAALPKCWSAQ